MDDKTTEKPKRPWKPIIPFSKAKWVAIRHSYFEDGVWKAAELAMLHSVSINAIQARMSREKWKEKLELKFKKGEVQDTLSKQDDLKDLNELMVSRRESSNRQMIESTTALLDKVHRRIKVLNPNDGSEIAEMIGALKSLQGMLAGLLGGTKAGYQGPQMQVNILARIIEEGDKANALADGKVIEIGTQRKEPGDENGNNV